MMTPPKAPPSLRPLALCLLLALTACSSKHTRPPAANPSSSGLAPVPAGFHAVSGQLLGAPAGTEIDLALLQTGLDNRPQRLLANLTLPATGQAQRFRIPFNPQSLSPGQHIVLHGRVTRSGMLIQRLPQRPVSGPQSSDLGLLRLVPAP